MFNWLAEEMRSCIGMQEICDAALGMSLKLTSASFGNLQLTDRISGFLKIESQRGFREPFLKAFERVHPAGGSVCARALRNSSPTVVEDVMLDRAFAPYRGIAEEAGFRAVSSTPIISPGGMVLGVLSQHFPQPHKLTGAEAKNMELPGAADGRSDHSRT